jgi:hypothetical protein
LNPIATPVAPHADDHAKRRKRRRLGKHLVKQGIVTKSAVRSALEEQERTGHRLGEILVARGALDPVTLVKALADQDLVETVSSSDRVAQALPISVAFEYRAVVLVDDTDVESRVTRVAVTDLATVPAIWEALGRPIEPKLTDPATMERLLSRAYPDARDASSVEALASSDHSEDEPQMPAAGSDESVAVDDDPQPSAGDTVSEPVTEAAAHVETLSVSTDVATVEATEEPPQQAAQPEVPEGQPSVTQPVPAVESAQTQEEPPSRPDAPTTMVGTDAQASPPATEEPAWAPPVSPAGTAAVPAAAHVAPAARRSGLRRLFGRQPVPATPPIRAVAPPRSSNGSAPSDGVSSEPSDTAAPELELPVATVIVGLRQASPATLSRLMTLIEAIDYPRDQLQVLAVHDPADRVTRRALHDQPLPIWVTETVVSRTGTPGPRGLLLCGLRDARGELVTVLSLGQPLEPTLLRMVGSGEDESALASVDVLGSRSLTNAFLRQAEPHGLETVTPADVTTIGMSTTVFRVAELRAAFGWPSAVALS